MEGNRVNQANDACGFEIMTDSTVNLPAELIEQYGFHILSLVFEVDGVEYRGYEKGKPVDLAGFYGMMRERKEIRTSLVNGAEAARMAKELLERGRDLLYVGFSSGLSGTYQTVSLALRELKEEYPEREICCVDSLSAGLGEGLLVRKAGKMREDGCTVSEVCRWVQDNRLHVCHEFTVEDLFFLKRGGRIRTAAAVVGSALHVKPVLYVDDEGHLVPRGRVRGRKKSLDALVERMEQNAVRPEEQDIYICHGDCPGDAEYVAARVRERMKVRSIGVQVLDPVIGAHSGPGTVGLFYMGGTRV